MKKEVSGNRKSKKKHLLKTQEEEDDLLVDKCKLCNRERPVFASDEQLTRLPDRSLTDFLKQLKADAATNRPYLRMLRLNSNYIKACGCQNMKVHGYCKTVDVI